METEEIHCDVLVIGGSTSALFAALHAAREGASTCLVEPTDWAGGQLTAGGVPAVDFAWREDVQGVDTKAAHKDRRNNHHEFSDWLETIGNPGDCTVSRHCFLPRRLLRGPIAKAIQSEPNLRVFYNTVPIAVETVPAGNKVEISTVKAVARFAKKGGGFAGYERVLSAAIEDWYSPRETEHFHKQRLVFVPRQEHKMIVVEASEFGDVLALTNSRYLVGGDLFEGSTEQEYSGRGQSFTATFNLSIGEHGQASRMAGWLTDAPPDKHEFNLGSYGWDGVWRYRRLRGAGPPAAGQTSVMNWRQGAANNGNDYAARHLFLSYAAARQSVAENRWLGGIDIAALRGAERRSRDFGRWFAGEAPEELRHLIYVDAESVETRHGFYKFPYLRESRRSIGYGGFLLCAWDLSCFPGPTGFPFADRVATTVYDYDIHTLNGDGGDREKADTFLRNHPKPFYLPLRAFSNDTTANLIVAGKCMAQSYLANAATRLQPGEAVSGTAAGVAAAYCASGKTDMHGLIEAESFAEVQDRVSRYQPLDWVIGGQIFPGPDDKPVTEEWRSKLGREAGRR